MSIEVRRLTKTFGNFTALLDVSLTIETGRMVALLGPSGSGKTTLLRIIAGLEFPDSGSILFDGDDATGRSARDRRVGFVFQHYALFRHMTVFENIAFGLRVRPRRTRPSEAEIRAQVQQVLRLMQLEGLSSRFASQLSGGQRQRVALARALVVEPRVLLLDEPFGSLDAKVRQELRRWLRHLHSELKFTSLFVTHDQEEAFEVADEVVVMNVGRVEQYGPPEDVYDSPANPFVYNFLGRVNVFKGLLRSGSLQIGALTIGAPSHADVVDAAAVACARPHELDLDRPGTDAEGLDAVITEIHAAGPLVRVELARTDTGDSLEAEISKERHRQLALHVGDAVLVRIRNLRVFLNPPST